MSEYSESELTCFLRLIGVDVVRDKNGNLNIDETIKSFKEVIREISRESKNNG